MPATDAPTPMPAFAAVDKGGDGVDVAVAERLVTTVTVDGGISGDTSVEIVLDENVERPPLEVLWDRSALDELVDRGMDEMLRGARLEAMGSLYTARLEMEVIEEVEAVLISPDFHAMDTP